MLSIMIKKGGIHMKKKIVYGLYGIGILFVVWVFVSFIDVNLHNKFGTETYWFWNFFELLLKWKGLR